MLNSKGKPNITFEMGRQQQVRPSVVSVGRHENNSDKRLWCDLDCCRRESFFQHAFLCQYHAAVPSVASGTGVHQCHRGNPIGLLLLFQRCSVLAAWGLIALFPANIHMALHSELYTYASPLGLWLHLPLQFGLIGWAYWYTRTKA